MTTNLFLQNRGTKSGRKEWISGHRVALTQPQRARPCHCRHPRSCGKTVLRLNRSEDLRVPMIVFEQLSQNYIFLMEWRCIEFELNGSEE